MLDHKLIQKEALPFGCRLLAKLLYGFACLFGGWKTCTQMLLEILQEVKSAISLHFGRDHRKFTSVWFIALPIHAQRRIDKEKGCCRQS